MSKKVTIHDVAKEAGVSAATVSYVVNNREDQSISEETRQKVLHVINMLNYKPSVFAKNLRQAPESKLVAVCADCKNMLTSWELYNVIKNLATVFSDNYSLTFAVDLYERFTNTDAIIAYNVDRETFYNIGKANYIPLIAMDCLIDDKLFFQITADYDKLSKAVEREFCKDFTYVCITPSNDELKKKIETSFKNVRFVSDVNDLLNIKENNLLITHGVVYDFFKDSGKRLYFAEDLYLKKCKQTANCIEKALSHESFDVHFYEV